MTPGICGWVWRWFDVRPSLAWSFVKASLLKIPHPWALCDEDPGLADPGWPYLVLCIVDKLTAVGTGPLPPRCKGMLGGRRVWLRIGEPEGPSRVSACPPLPHTEPVAGSEVGYLLVGRT